MLRNILFETCVFYEGYKQHFSHIPTLKDALDICFVSVPCQQRLKQKMEHYSDIFNDIYSVRDHGLKHDLPPSG